MVKDVIENGEYDYYLKIVVDGTENLHWSLKYLGPFIPLPIPND
jgi:hypothetical protein